MCISNKVVMQRMSALKDKRSRAICVHPSSNETLHPTSDHHQTNVAAPGDGKRCHRRAIPDGRLTGKRQWLQ